MCHSRNLPQTIIPKICQICHWRHLPSAADLAVCWNDLLWYIPDLAGLGRFLEWQNVANSLSCFHFEYSESIDKMVSARIYHSLPWQTFTTYYYYRNPPSSVTPAICHSPPFKNLSDLQLKESVRNTVNSTIGDYICPYLPLHKPAKISHSRNLAESVILKICQICPEEICLLQQIW